MPSPPSAPNFAEPDTLPALHLPSLQRLTLEDLQLETAEEAVSSQHLHREVGAAHIFLYILGHMGSNTLLKRPQQ
jgi:hypothetical protein